jgi:hypothetical protein
MAIGAKSYNIYAAIRSPKNLPPAAARLRHSNVASVLHLGRTGNRYFYAMEFVEGETLENLIKRK